MTGSGAAPEDEAPARDQQQPQEAPKTVKAAVEGREEGEELEEELTPSTAGKPAATDTPTPRVEEDKPTLAAAAVKGTPESRARRVKAGSLYERYLNIKQGEVNKTGGSMQEISNSTDEQEREAGEYTAARQRAFMDQQQRQAPPPPPPAGPASGSPRANGNGDAPRMFNDGHEVFSPRGPPRGRSRSRSRSPRRNGGPPPPFEQGGPRFQGGRRGSPPRQYSKGDGPPPRGRSRSRSRSPRPFDRRGPMSPRGGGGESRGPINPHRGGRGPMSPRGEGGGRGWSPPRNFGGRGPMGRSPPREFGGRGDMRRSPPREFRGREPMGRSPPREYGGRGPMGRSPPRDMMERGGGPPPRFRSRSRSPPRGPPSRDGPFRGHPGSPGGFGPSRQMSPPRGFDPRGPPPPRYDSRGPPPPFDMRGPPSRGRSRSRSPPRPRSAGEMSNGKRDRSWERGGPTMDMMPKRPAYEAPMMTEHPVGDWTFDLKRSGKPRCRCRAVAQGIPVRVQLPLVMDVVELPHLVKFAEFLYLDRPNVRRVVYELHPDSIVDRRGYDEFCDYLMQGRNNVARAGVAREMEKQGYKVFILPPGQAARSLGYKGQQMIACVRSR